MARIIEELAPDSKTLRKFVKAVKNDYTMGERFLNMLKGFRKGQEWLSKGEKNYLEELYTAVNEAVANGKRAVASEDIKYSTTESFGKQVDNVIGEEDTNSTHPMIRETTPQLLQDIGLANKPMLITATHAKTAVGVEVKNKNIHKINIDVFKNLPNLLEDPAIVMDSTKEGSIVMFVNAKDKESVPILCAVLIEGKGRYNNVKHRS